MAFLLHLAPLHGITNHVFRNAYFRHFRGFDAAMAPFIMSKHIIHKNNTILKDLLPENNSGITIIPQILSNNADEFISLAENLKDLGYTEINLNLGCPYKMVANKKRGSGLLPFPQLIEQFLEKVCAENGFGLSLKIRLGRERADEIHQLIPIFNRYPLKKIIIHPRTGIQMYEGAVDLEAFAEAAKLLKHPVSYNGDITNKETFDSLRERFPFVNEWMIGRGALINPLLSEILVEGKSPADGVSRVRAFHDDLLHCYEEVLFGDSHVLGKMKEIWSYLGRSFADSEKMIKQLSKSKKIGEYKAAVNAIFNSLKWTG